MNRTLVDRALKKAAECEEKNDNEGVKHWMNVAEDAEKTYNKIDNKKGGNDGKL